MNIKLTLVSLLIFVLIGCKKEDEQNVNNADSALPPNITEPAPDPTDPPTEPPTDPSLPVNPTDFLVAEITENLPPVISINASYPLAFSFKNPSETETATEILISENLPTSFNKISNTCGAQLAPLAQCDIKGEITSPLPGDISASWTLNYKEGDPLLLSVSTRAEEQIKDQMTAQIRNGLPTQITTNKTYPFSIRYKNNSTNLNATGLNLTFKNEHLLSNLSNKCVGILEPQNHCTIMGNISTDKPGPISFSTILNYSEGIPEEINLISTATETNTITGHFSHEIPSNIALNTPYPVSFIFTNTSKTVTATQVQLTPAYPPEFTQLTTNCSQELAPKTQCQVTGEIVSTQPTENISLFLTLQYQQGQPVVLSKTITSARVAVVGEIRRNISENVSMGTEHTVNFRFTNQSESLFATSVSVTYQDPTVFNELLNTCTATLGPTGWCSITGQLKPSAEGDFNFSATMQFAEGHESTLPFKSFVTALPILSRVNESFPTYHELGKTYPINYIFLNSTKEATATNIKITLPTSPYFKLISNHCQKTLLPMQSCEVLGEITPNDLMDSSSDVIFSYAEGKDIHVNVPINVVPLTSVNLNLNAANISKKAFTTQDINIDYSASGDREKSGYLVLKELQNTTLKTFLDSLTLLQGVNTSSTLIFEINGHRIPLTFSVVRPADAQYFPLNAADSSARDRNREIYVSLSQADFNQLPVGEYVAEVSLIRQRWLSLDADALVRLKINISR